MLHYVLEDQTLLLEAMSIQIMQVTLIKGKSLRIDEFVFTLVGGMVSW